MSKSTSYAELSGGVGRSVHFRSERFRSRAILRRLKPNLIIAGGGANLYDVSMNGISFHLPDNGKVPEENEELHIRLTLAGAEAFSGTGRVVRTELEPGGQVKVAVSLVDSFLDVPRMIRIHDIQAFKQEVARGLDIYDCVPDEYRQICGEVALFLRHWQRLLDNHEKGLGEHGGSTGWDIESRAEARMREGWQRLRSQANAASRECYNSRAVLQAAKALTELQVTPLVVLGPIWARAYEKPFGYPGDFRMMNYMYNDKRQGASAYSRIMHQLGREERLAATVPSRRNLMLEQIEKMVQSAEGTGPIRISCLASGPAREVEDYLKKYNGERHLIWTLIDQDDRALSYANDRLLRAAAGKTDRIQVNCLFTSFRQLVGNRELLGEISGQDFLYSAGFFDYLTRDQARMVASRCLEMLRPGGRLLFGNAAAGPDVHWVPEFVLDWHMIYREGAELEAVLPGEATGVNLLSDDSNSWHFIEAHRDR